MSFSVRSSHTVAIRSTLMFSGLLILGCSGKIATTTIEVDGQRTDVLTKVGKEGDSTVVSMTSYHENGQVSVERKFKKGVPNGQWKWYGLEGSLDTMRLYKDSLLDGKSRAWHTNGELFFEQIFKAGNRVGRWRTWYDDKTLRSLSEYSHNELDGVAVEWYSSGAVSRLVEYDMGKKSGTASEWSPMGQMMSHEVYLDDVPHIFITWHDSGELRTVKAYREGEEEWAIEWDRHGRRTSSKLHANHTVHRDRFKNGNRQIEADFIGEKKHGAELEWHQNGQMAVMQFFVRNRVIYERAYNRRGEFGWETVSVKGEPIWSRKKEPKIPS